MNNSVILKVQDLEVSFYNNERCNGVLRGMSLQLEKGKVMCIVGESGYGKSVTANSVIGLLPDLSRIKKGEVHFYDKGKDIRIDRSKRKGREMREIHGDGIVVMLQDPMTALNPISTVGYQINESFLYHNRAKSKSDAKEKAVSLLKDMGVSLPEKRVDGYLYQFSEDMYQRVMIAMTMSCQPRVLIADESATTLDVTIQAQIFELMPILKNNHNVVILLTTYDMGVVAELTDNVAIMYMGNITESGDAKAVLTHSAHPYTRALLKPIPVLERNKKQELEPIKGSAPDPYNRSKGCQLAPRCEFVADWCMEEMPPEVQLEPGHHYRCFRGLMRKEG